MIQQSLTDLSLTLLSVLRDVAPIVVVMFVFQLVILRKPIPHLRRVLIGLVYVVLGLAFFLFGLERALFPLGRAMAAQLTDPGFLGLAPGQSAPWTTYYWVYIFAFAIGFATTIAEPSLIAVSLKAQEVSGGSVRATGLRLAVALGVALSLAVGTFRIVTGTPLHYYIIAGYIVVILQTLVAPKLIIALAYDSGGVTTSTVTVPLVTALGLGLAGTVPGRSVLLDGFGLIAFASLFPMMTVMSYAQVAEWRTRDRSTREAGSTERGD